MKTMPASKIANLITTSGKERNRIARAAPRILVAEGRALARWYGNFLAGRCLVCSTKLGKKDEASVCERCIERLPESPNFIDNRHPLAVLEEMDSRQVLQTRCCRKCYKTFNLTAGDIISLHNRFGGYRPPNTCPGCLKKALDARKRNKGLRHKPFKQFMG